MALNDVKFNSGGKWASVEAKKDTNCPSVHFCEGIVHFSRHHHHLNVTIIVVIHYAPPIPYPNTSHSSSPFNYYPCSMTGADNACNFVHYPRHHCCC